MYIHTTYKNTYIHTCTYLHMYETVDQIDTYNTPRGCDCGQPHELCKTSHIAGGEPLWCHYLYNLTIIVIILSQFNCY